MSLPDKTIGIIGLGVVGTSHQLGFSSRGYKVYGYDLYKKTYSGEENKKICFSCPVVFVSVPTPTTEHGRFKAVAIAQVLSDLTYKKYPGVVVIKSTILPEVLHNFIEIHKDLRIVHNPEFLTARTADRDFHRQKAVLLSGSLKDVDEVKEIYEHCLINPKFIISENCKDTAMAKYMANVFFASKISVWNEFYKVCQRHGIDFELSKQMAFEATGWFSKDHTKVPGPDGEFGFGGECFPKDIRAFYTWAKEEGLNTIGGAIETNLQIKEDAEWARTTDENLNEEQRKINERAG